MRTDDVFKTTIYAKGAINISVDEIRKPENLLPKDKNTPILLMDNRGKGSLNALLIMLAKGYKNVKHYYRFFFEKLFYFLIILLF